MCSKLRSNAVTSQPRKRLALAVAAVLAAALGVRSAQADAIKFCLDKANPMFNVDAAVANAVAASQHDTATLVVHDSSQDDEDEDSGNSQVKFFARLSKTCDLIMGFPVEAQFQNLPDGMGATRPYVRTGFVTATTSAAISPFASMAARQKLGVVMMTVASTYFTQANMANEYVYYSNDELYGALLKGEVNGALIWQPWLNREVAAHPQALHVASLNMPHAAWDIVALYPEGAQNNAAVRAFNKGIAALEANDRLRAVVQPYKVPSGVK
jgi:hypothetical protein